MKNRDRLFYIVQALFMNFELSIFDKIRPFIYRGFFRRMGSTVRICAGVQFKYPSEIEIGDYSYIGRACVLVGMGGLAIGKYALIGAGSKICSTSHVAEDLNTPICFQGIRSKKIIIGSNVWIGFDTKVLLGSKIGDSSIVAANSVILEDSVFEGYSMVAGAPAVLKGKRDVRK